MHSVTLWVDAIGAPGTPVYLFLGMSIGERRGRAAEAIALEAGAFTI
jgi:hypothetical protein